MELFHNLKISLRGAELIKMYGAVDKGGMVTHVTYPDSLCKKWKLLYHKW